MNGLALFASPNCTQCQGDSMKTNAMHVIAIAVMTALLAACATSSGYYGEPVAAAATASSRA